MNAFHSMGDFTQFFVPPYGGGFVFLAMNLPVIAGGAISASALFPGKSNSAARTAAYMLIPYSAIVFISTILGATGLLRPVPLIISSFIFLAAAATARKLAFQRAVHPQGINTDSQSKETPENLGPVAMLFVFSAAVISCMIFVWGVLSPPPPWDAYVYHLPFAATWLQDGRISLVTVPFGDQAGTYFPCNTELYYAWLMIPFHSEMLTNAGQFPFYCMIGILTYFISREIGAKKNPAAIAGAVSMFIPGIMHQAVSSEVDIIFAALFLFSLFFLLKYFSENTTGAFAVFSGLSIGLMAGTKYVGILLSLILVIPSLLIILKNRRFSHALSYIFAAFIGGGFWYVRNWFVTGNPIFPLTFKLFGLEVFDGGYSRVSMMQAVFHTGSFVKWLYAIISTTGMPLLILLSAAMIFVPIAFISKSGRPSRNSIYVFIVPAIFIAACGLLVPYNLESRFTFAAWALAASCIALLLNSNLTILRAVFTVFASAAVAWSLFTDNLLSWLPKYLYSIYFGSFRASADTSELDYESISMRPAAILLALCIMFALPAIWIYAMDNLNPRKRLASMYSFSSISVLFFLIAVAAALPAYRNYRLTFSPQFRLGKAWNYLDMYQNRFGPAAANIEFTGIDLSFGLFGGNLQNRVYSVPINKNASLNFHDCVKDLKRRGGYKEPMTDRIDFCRRNPDENAWIANLAARKTDFVLISVLHQNDLPHIAHDGNGFPVELSWAISHKDKFKAVYANPQVRIFKFKPQE